MTTPLEEKNLTELIDHRAYVKTNIEEINKQLKELKAELDYNDTLLLRKMDTEGVRATANTTASVSINEETVANVEDWDAFYNHLSATNDFSLLQRRVSNAAFREVISQEGESVPGLVPRTMRRISFNRK